MQKNNRIFITVLFVFVGIISLGSTVIQAAFNLGDWQYVKTIGLPAENNNGSLIEIVPDREVFAGSITGLVDLRVVDDKNAEVPYKIEISQDISNRTSFSATLLDKGYIPGQYTSFIIDLKQTGILHNEIKFETSTENFRCKAIIEASSDRNKWANIAEQTVFDFTVRDRNFKTSDTRIRYPESTARYIRVKILDEGEGALTINGASIFYVKEDAVKEVQWPSSLIGTSRDSNQRTTIVTIDMRTPGIPTHRLTVTIPEVNFHRDVRIQTSNNQKEWRTILSNSQIYAYDTAKFAGSSLSITYPETTDRYLRLVISDLDSPPLTVQGVGVWGIWRRVVFAAEERRTYRLFYGNPHASRPSYDIERIFPYLETESLTQAQLGHQKVNPDYIEKTPPLPPFTERMPWLLPIVITVATILIAFILFKVVRQARNMLPPPSE